MRLKRILSQATQLAFDDAADPALLAGDEDAVRIPRGSLVKVVGTDTRGAIGWQAPRIFVRDPRVLRLARGLGR